MKILKYRNKSPELIKKILACQGNLTNLSIAKVLSTKEEPLSYTQVFNILYKHGIKSNNVSQSSIKEDIEPKREFKTDHGMLFNRTVKNE